MKNLEMMGVQEMDAIEIIGLNGGFAPPMGEWLAIQICSFIAGFSAGWTESKR